jgi:type VI secretion system secreted protein VgrG
VTAQKTVKLISATQNIEAAAKQEILLTSGGAYIRLKDGNIEIHAPGKIDIKGAQHAFAGPAQVDYALPALPVSATPQMYSQRVDVKPILGQEFSIPYERVPYAFKDASGNVVHSGMLDENGQTGRVFTEEESNLKLYVGDDPWRLFIDSKHLTDDA